MKYLKKIYESIDDKKIIIVHDNVDWEGLYYNGQLLDQGNNIQLEKVLKQLGYDIKYEDITDEDMEDLGTLPQKLSDLQSLLNFKKYNV